jgi:DNA ligase-associated metallophosphoesterase
MQQPFHYKLQHQNCWLSAQRMLFWEEEKALIVSDLHFGKTGHFRKAGIAVPQSIYKEDLQRLISQLQYFQPKQLIVVGDMFHSHENKELDWFKKWRFNFPDLSIKLIKGNHDVLQDSWYRESAVTVYEKSLQLTPFHFLHDPLQTSQENYYFSGHIHPGVRIEGLARQSLRFPCFYFSTDFCVLPAFSLFTGLSLVEQKPGDVVFAIINQSIVAV